MLKEMRSLARETVVYGLSTVLGRLLNFLLTPLFTHLLSPSDNGVIATTYAYVAFLTVVFGLGLDTAYLRLGRKEGKADPRAFSTAFWAVAGASVFFAALITAAAEGLAPFVDAPASVLRCAAWILALDAVASLPFAELRGAQRASAYASIRLTGLALNLVLCWFFVARMGLGVTGVFLANLMASSLSLALLIPVLLRRVTGGPEAALLRPMLAFALPLIPAGLASIAVNVVDRPILGLYYDSAVVGVYSASYKLGILMMLVVTMFDQAWKPFFLQRAGQPGLDALMARVLTYFTAGAAWVFLAVALLAAPAVTAPLFAGRPLIHPLFWGGLSIVPIVTFGYLLAGLYYVMLAPLMIAGRTGGVAVATACGAAVNLLSLLLLVPRWGMLGAACATAAAYGAMALAVFVQGRRAHPVPYEWGRVAVVAAPR